MLEISEAFESGKRFGRGEAANIMRAVLGEGVSPLKVAGLLCILRYRGVEAEELAGFVDALRERQVDIKFDRENLIDSCGTGGGRPTVNLSTGAAFLAAGAGCSIAKHGNRSVTSACGSADVLEAMGISLSADQGFLKRTMAEAGMAFLFAPAFHPALKAVGPIRKELGVRTVFNQLGPLLNPARARRQIIGVFDPSMLRPMAEALVLLGAERAFVVHSEDGLDEFSPCAPTRVAEVRDGEVREYTVAPADFGREALCDEDIAQPGSAREAADWLARAFEEPEGKGFGALVPNAAACLVVAGIEEDWRQAADRVMAAGQSGAVRGTWERMIEMSRMG
jgi:anthranilate phosphoribosyltransferase